MEQLEVIGTQYGRIACLRVVSAVCARIITIVSEAITMLSWLVHVIGVL